MRRSLWSVLLATAIAFTLVAGPVPGGPAMAWAASAPATAVDAHGGRDLRIDWATASNQPTAIHFDPVRTSELRLEMTSPSPGSTTGFLQIAELQARSE